jgi:hypothetical protein
VISEEIPSNFLDTPDGSGWNASLGHGYRLLPGGELVSDLRARHWSNSCGNRPLQLLDDAEFASHRVATASSDLGPVAGGVTGFFLTFD